MIQREDKKMEFGDGGKIGGRTFYFSLSVQVKREKKYDGHTT